MRQIPTVTILDSRWLGAADASAALPHPAGPEVAFLGRSNVGKSSLINALLRRRTLLRTSQTPGCTRAMHAISARIRLAKQDGVDEASTLGLIDVPGYGYAARSRAEKMHWQQSLVGLLHERASLRGLVLLQDIRRDLREEDIRWLRLAAQQGLFLIVALTKIDKIRSSERADRLRSVSQGLRASLADLPVRSPIAQVRDKGIDRATSVRVVGTSARTGTGLEELWLHTMGLVWSGGQRIEPH